MKASILLQNLNQVCDDAKELWEQIGIDGGYDNKKVADQISEIESFRENIKRVIEACDVERIR